MKKQSKLDIYNRKRKASKILKVLAPIVFWGCLVGAIVCLYFAFKNSFGNMANLIDLLDSKKYTGEQLSENYAGLIEKYGEWIIGSGSTGFTIKFINIKKALFSGFMLLNFIGCVILLFNAYFLGKWLFPLLAEKFKNDAQDMANREVLKDK